MRLLGKFQQSNHELYWVIRVTSRYRISEIAGNLKGESVIITGGGSGIGEAALRIFVDAGAFVTFGRCHKYNVAISSNH